MGLGELIEKAIHARRARALARLQGPLGDFHRAGGNAQLLGGAPLTADDLVIDAGGFEGDFTAEVAWRFGCRSLVLEPVPGFAAALRSRFNGNSRVRVVEAALGATEGELQLTLQANGTSAFTRGPGPTVRAKQVDAAALIKAERPIGLLKLNIEGGEFDVLERLAAAGLLASIRSVLIQFHQLVPECEARRERVRATLAATHREVFNYSWVWERWDAR